MPDGGEHTHVGARDPVRDGVVHGLVRDHFAVFAEQAQEGGRALPRYIVEEFEAFLRCGALARGGRMKMIAALTERAGIVRILEHLGVPIEVPRMRRSRDGP